MTKKAVEVASGLHALANFITINADALEATGVLDAIQGTLNVWCADASEMVDHRRALGGRWEKVADDYLFVLRRKLGERVQVDLFASRGAVCERVQVGDPDAQVPTITTTEPVYEWICSPLLEGDA